MVRAVVLHYQEGNSDKYYTVYTHKGKGLVHWGRAASKGQSQPVDQTQAYERISEKKRKGYSVLWDGHFEHHGGWDQESLSRGLQEATYNSPGRGARMNTEDIYQVPVFVW